MRDGVISLLVALGALVIPQLMLRVDSILAQAFLDTPRSLLWIWGGFGLDIIFVISLLTSAWLIGIKLSPSKWASSLILVVAFLTALLGPVVRTIPDLLPAALMRLLDLPLSLLRVHSMMTIQSLALAGASAYSLSRGTSPGGHAE